jgi:phosphatidylglycerophosphate synthase
MVWWQQWRGRLLAPFLVWAERCGVSADHVTLASMVCGLLFCPLWLWPGQPGWAKIAALVGLMLHMLLDGLDGPLARHLGTASRRGSFTDTVADQFVVTTSTLALMTSPASALDVWVGGLYIFLYAMVVAFAMVRNALGVPYSWLLRPRFWVYAWIAIDAYVLPGWMNLVVGLFAAVLAWKLWTGFVALRRML